MGSLFFSTSSRLSFGVSLAFGFPHHLPLITKQVVTLVSKNQRNIPIPVFFINSNLQSTNMRLRISLKAPGNPLPLSVSLERTRNSESEELQVGQ